MRTSKYIMEGRNFNFEKYTTLYRNCHNQIDTTNKALIPPIPPMAERVKVQHYLAGIESPSLVAAIVAVRATLTLKGSFNTCANYLSTYMTQNSEQTCSMATLQFTKPKNNEEKNRSNTDNKDQDSDKKKQKFDPTKTYSLQEWNNLSRNKKTSHTGSL